MVNTLVTLLLVLAAVSQKLYDRLRAKRVTQIFEYLDAGSAAGSLDLVGLVRAPTAQMDNLDSEVGQWLGFFL